MAREFFDYNPDTGITYYTEHNIDPLNPDLVRIHAETDVEPLLDHCSRLRNENIHTVKSEYFHYAKVPPIVYLQLKQKGLDLYSGDEAMLKRIRREIEVNYPYIKTSYSKHI